MRIYKKAGGQVDVYTIHISKISGGFLEMLERSVDLRGAGCSGTERDAFYRAHQ